MLDVDEKHTNSLAKMKQRAIEYFTELYAAVDRPPLLPNLNITIENKPSNEENTKLRALPSGEEIWNTVKNMPNGKAPGMNGLTSELITHHWSSIKNDVTTAVLHFFNTKRMLRSLNLTTLALIPKKRTSERLADYRPISCLGVTYKIFSKILAS